MRFSKSKLLAAFIAVVLLTHVVRSQNKSQVEQEIFPYGAIVKIDLPSRLSRSAQSGEALFEENCATCHGLNAVGKRDIGPPLVHKIYEPNHHGDESFQLAVVRGVRAHHWKFGSMPAIEGLSRERVAEITLYIRELQRANNIF